MHGGKFVRVSLALIVAGLGLGLNQPLQAETVVATNASLSERLATLATGDQLIVGPIATSAKFAGQVIQFDGFSGVLGYASEVAYVIVADGRATAGEFTARRGRMLLIRPYGAGITVERFDAARLHASLEGNAAEPPAQSVLTSLSRLASGQKRAMFFGRFVPTDFNVASLGSAEDEIGRRGRVGGMAVREARFATPEPDIDIEQDIVERFVAALANGETDAVAEFLDPLPYGFSVLSDEGKAARRLMADALMTKHDWDRFKQAEVSKAGGSSWIVRGGEARATISLRRTTEFAFVQSIEVGE